jgi:hypothetical protein
LASHQQKIEDSVKILPIGQYERGQRER